ncbi:hypothetical protein [Agrobacterium rosae]|uniref:Yip1 domain-containing protein n=1 Tax=Agrobacterium rosae TaxID=1972867 RepID=A0AAW9FL84_9HYPH|nr:hypothetical protein [Agrobacterium rosae]MDX8303603.1 hypothetical protein [Agrobacterium rosae]POO56918.1 hypothetical protein CTT39_09725 [Agrobacterium rosae]
MPSRSELALYMRGLWLLFLGDPAGGRLLDLTDRGMARSFYAALWCLPSMALSWYWWHEAYLSVLPKGVGTGAIFFLRLAMVEAICWMVPLILIGILLVALGSKGKFPAIVVVANWLSVPFSYGYATLILIALLFPALQGLVAILWFALLLTLVFTFARILKFFIREQPLLVTALVMTLLVPGMILSEILQRFLGVYPN